MNVSQRGSVCASGTRFGSVHLDKIYIFIRYMLPTIWGVYVSGKYMLILDISRVHDNVHDDMNMSLIMHDHSLFIAMINISSPMINSLS